MICRKCGAELPNNTIRCSNCGIKVNMYCPECKTLNAFGSMSCKNCGFELIKICPACGSKNIYSANECRKCHFSLETSKKTITKKNSAIEVVQSYSSEQTSFIKDNNIQNQNDFSNSIPVVSQDSFQVPITEDNEKIFQVAEENNTKIQETEEIQNTLPDNKSDLINNEPINIQEIFGEDVEINPIVETENEEEYQVESDNETQNEEPITEDESKEEITNNTDEELNIEKSDKIDIQKDSVEKAIHLIKHSITKHIIAVNGEEGSGKSAVLKQTSNYLSRNGFLSLYGSCTPLIQITSFGFFQDAFLRLMGFPPYINNKESFINDFKNSNFANPFQYLNDSELNLFLNLFYPSQTSKFENILDNKKNMFSILEKVIKALLENNNLIITIDNFELLDGASYDFIIHMLKKGYFTNRLKLLVAYQENKAIQSYFDIDDDNESIFETILIKKFNKEELMYAVNKSTNVYWNQFLPEEIINELVQKANGNAIKMEQQIAFLFDKGYVELNNNIISVKEEKKPSSIPSSFEELIKIRLNSLSPNTKNVLFMAAIMGFRFSTNILCVSANLPIKKSEEILDQLMQELFIEYVDSYTCEFKSLTLWKLIYNEAKSDLLYKENSERLYNSLKPLILSSNLQKLISCTEALSKNEAFEIWENTAKLTAKLGDTNLYIISKKQCLKLLEECDFENSESIKYKIYEEIGKLLYEKSPQEAVTYLANVLDIELKNSNTKKIIDLSGYFIKSCYLTGNYFGANEAADAVLSNIINNNIEASQLEIALIKTRKLKALLSIGNSEQIINLVKEEIISEIEDGLLLKDIDSKFKNLIINAWFTSKIALAKAYAIQGNNKVFEIINEVKESINKYNYNSMYYSTQIYIIDAFYSTLTGNINKSVNILNDISDKYTNRQLQPNLLAEWNLVNIINRVMSGQDENLKVDLFELAAFTNNINEPFIKNIIKLILGYILKEEGNTAKALEIFNEEITYFAKEKLAIGALLSWALIVQITMNSDSQEDIENALNTATKALEIAQSSKINNYFFILYFQKYIAEIYEKKQDFIAAKMYLEKAILIAKQFNLTYQLIELYMSYAKYIENVMKSTQSYTTENTNIVIDMYNKAYDYAQELNLDDMTEKASRERSAFKTFCQLHSVEV